MKPLGVKKKEVNNMEMTYKCGCTTEVDEATIAARFVTAEHAQAVYGTHRCVPCDYEALFPEEKAHFNLAYQKAQALGHPFTEGDILQEAWDEGYELFLQYDPRFVQVGRGRDGFPLWNIV